MAGQMEDHAQRGCSLFEGPHHKWSWRWYFNIPGSEYLSLYLWLIKDFLWSQLYYPVSTLTFGALALAWIMLCCLVALKLRLFSEAYIAFGALLWLAANYIWCVGNELVMNYGFPGTTYDIGYYIARWVFMSASVWLLVYCVVLIPLDFFAKDRELPLMRRVNANAPPTRFRGYFHEFREYEAVHVFFWALKDTIWIWSEPGFSETIQDVANAALCDEQQLSPCDVVANVTAFCSAQDPPLSPCAPEDVYPGSFVAGNMSPVFWPYAVVYAIVILLTLDLMFILAVHKRQFIDVVHVVIVLLWVVANGIWAHGEIVDEPQCVSDEFANYVFLDGPLGWCMIGRNVVGWMFFSACMILCLFYTHWFAVSLCSAKLPTYTQSLEEDYEHAGLRKTDVAPDSANSSQGEAASPRNDQSTTTSLSRT